ncbi:unnamed protein product, partial [marine sediment metagenome]
KYNKIIQLLKDKSNNILEPIDAEDVDAFITFMQEFNSDIETYNSQVRKWNTEINILKEKQLDLYELEKELKELEIKQKRLSSDISEICKKYSKISKNIEHNKKLVEEKRGQHDIEVSQKIEKYGHFHLQKMYQKFLHLLSSHSIFYLGTYKFVFSVLLHIIFQHMGLHFFHKFFFQELN